MMNKKASKLINKRYLAIVLIITLALFIDPQYHEVRGESGDYLSPLDVVSDGINLYVTEATASTIAVWNIASKSVTQTFTLPKNPRGIALSQDKTKLYVTAGVSDGVVYILEKSSGNILQTINVGHTPNNVILSPDGNTLYVCNRFDNDVSVVSLTSYMETGRVEVLREAYDGVITPDGLYLYVINHLPAGPANADYVGASVTVIRTSDNTVVKQIALPNGSDGVKDICIAPDGNQIFVTHILARYAYPTTQLDRGWINTNGLSIIDTSTQTLNNTVLLDDVDMGAANPWGVACTSDGQYIVVTHAGTHEVSLINRATLLSRLAQIKSGSLTTNTVKDAGDVPNDLSFLYDIRDRIQLDGNGPRGLVIEGNKIYTCDYYSDSISIVDISTKTSEKIALGTTTTLDIVRKGEMLWNDATSCYQKWESCASCHPDARVDGLNWDNLNDGLGDPKNAKSMLLSYLTPPMMVTGVRPNTESAVRKGMTFIQMAIPADEDVDAVYSYLKSLKPVPSPVLVNGALSASAQRGKDLFEGSAGCIGCHTPPLYTNMKLRKVGTNTAIEDRAFDVPSLMEVWRSGPYLHDGRATSIREVFTTYNMNNQHGNTSGLSESQLDDLEQFILSICDTSIITEPTESYQDNFNDGNADGWTTYSGTWTVNQNQYTVNSSSGAIAIANNTNFYDTTYTGIVTVGTSGKQGLIFRVTSPGDGNDAYKGYSARISTTGVELGRVNNGYTAIGSSTMPLTSGSQHTMKIVALDNVIKVYVDDMSTPKIDVTDDAYKWGAIGVSTTEGSGTYDDIQAVKYMPPPAKPTGVTLEVLGQDTVNLQWEAVSEATGYHVYRATTSDGNYSALTSNPITDTHYEDIGLSQGSTYYYKVTALNLGGESEASNMVQGTVNPPAVPTGITVSVTGTRSLDISYGAVSGASHYVIYRSEVIDGTYEKIHSVPITDTTYNDTGLTPSTTYYYKIGSKSATGESLLSAPTSGTTATPISESFSDSFDDGNADGWITHGGSWDISNNQYHVSPNAGAKAMVKYSEFTNFTYESDITVGSSGNAGILFRVTNPGTGADAYNGYYAGISTSGIELGKASHNWTRLDTHNMSITSGNSYHMKVEAEGTSIKVYLDDMTSPKITVTDATHASGAIGVRTYNADAKFDNIVVTKNGLLTTPTDLTATASGENSINLQWSAVSSASGYHIYHATTSDGTYNKLNAITITGTTYSHTGLDAGSTHYYKISAVDSNNDESSQSASVSATTQVIATSFSDNFNDGNADGWTVHGGTWQVTNNAYQVGAYTGGKSVADNTNITNMIYEADVTIGSTGNAGVIFRVSNPSSTLDGYQGYYAGISTTKVEVGKANNNWSWLGTANVSLTTGTSHHLKVVANGSSIKVYVDDMTTPKVDVTDTSYSSGSIGLRTYKCDAIYDNISVMQYVEAPTSPTGLTATANGIDNINLSFTAVQGVDGYHVYKSSASDGTYTKLTSSVITGTTYSDTGLTADTTYYYKVSAVNAGGESALSTVASATTDQDVVSYTDNFDDGNANGWTTYGSTWQVSNNKYQVSAHPGAKAVASNTDFTDFTYEADVTIGSSGNAGVIFRVANPASGTDQYQGYYAGISTGKAEVGKANNNWSELGSHNMANSAGSTHHIKVVVSGSSIKFYVSDMQTPKISVTDTTYTTGSIGVRTYQCDATFDNVSVVEGTAVSTNANQKALILVDLAEEEELDDEVDVAEKEELDDEVDIAEEEALDNEADAIEKEALGDEVDVGGEESVDNSVDDNSEDE